MTCDPSTWLDAVRQGVAAAAPAAGAFARHVHVVASTGSTNDDVAAAAVVGAPEGYTVIAGGQTAGRGRRGAAWHSPVAHGLYLSTLLTPAEWPVAREPKHGPAASLITLMAGVAVASAITDVCAASIELKWPNDVMVPASALRASAGQAPVSAHCVDSAMPPWRKLAGILAEGASDGTVVRTVVLGIGINVCRSDAPADLASRMVALAELTPPSQADSAALLRPLVTALLVRMCAGVEQLANGGAAAIRERWRLLAPSVQGTPVRWEQQGVTRAGHADGIDEAGALRVIVPGQGEVTVHGGEVEWAIGATHDA